MMSMMNMDQIINSNNIVFRECLGSVNGNSIMCY